jgi:hypothetical protein
LKKNKKSSYTLETIREEEISPEGVVCPGTALPCDREPSLFILFSMTDKIKFTFSEETLLKECVNNTIKGSLIVRNAARNGFEGYHDKLREYFGISTPSMINRIADGVEDIHFKLSNRAQYLTFYNITKPKNSIIFNKNWVLQYSHALKHRRRKRAPGAGTADFLRSKQIAAVNEYYRRKPYKQNYLETYSYRQENIEKWVESQRGVNVNIDFNVLNRAVPLVNAMQLIYGEVALFVLDLNVAKSKERLALVRGNVLSDLKILAATDPYLAVESPGNWAAFMAYFDVPMTDYAAENLRLTTVVNVKAPWRSVDIKAIY